MMARAPTCQEPTPEASVVKTYPEVALVPNWNPEVLNVPFTSSLVAGVDVPIPTSPLANTVTTSALFVPIRKAPFSRLLIIASSEFCEILRPSALVLPVAVLVI